MADEIILTRLLTARDIVHIADNMRQSDRHEIWQMNRKSPLVALMQSIKATERPWIAKTLDGEPFSIFGTVVPVLGDTAIPWMVGTDTVAAQRRALVRVTKDYCRSTLTLYPTLRNYVLDENEASKRYLKCVGFELGPPEDWPTGCTVREFKMERPNV